MTNDSRPHSSQASRSRTALCFLLLVALVAASSACQSGDSKSGTEARGIIVVNAPAAGVVRRIIAREGVAVGEGAPIVEIAVLDETPASTPTPGESAASRAGRSYKAADAEIEAARSEAVRHDAEVQRLTPLVASGEAPQSQLDGERALYERAQQRVQQAQDAKQRAENELRAARSSGQNQEGAAAPAPPRERIIAASASSAGTVSVINVRVGERVTAGQPLATLRANE